MVFQYLARGYPTATAGRTGAQPLAHRAILRGCQGRVWFGSLPGPALGWAASASRAGDAGLQFFGASALDAYRPGRLFPLRGAPVVPGGPSPGAAVALPRRRVMAHRDQSNCTLSPYTNLPK